MKNTERISELRQLRIAFEKRARKFPNLSLKIYYFINGISTSPDEKFDHPNHCISLWKYADGIKSTDDPSDFGLSISDQELVAVHPQFGIRGFPLVCMVVISGKKTDQFVRMAKNCGSLIPDSINFILANIISDNIKNANNFQRKAILEHNGDSLNNWLKFMIAVNIEKIPERVKLHSLTVDPFTASLIAIDYLIDMLEIPSEPEYKNSDMSYEVGFSFPGEYRENIKQILTHLELLVNKNQIFYDNYHKAKLARPNLDLYLQDVYHNKCKKIVILLCKEYDAKMWCGIEWRSIRDLINKKRDEDIILLKADDADVSGIFSHDGYIDIRHHTPEEIAQFIFERINS